MSTSPPATEYHALRLAEAVELCAAWASATMRERGIRVLVIKGTSLTHHGLRDQREPADVDLLVDPACVETACEELESAGWLRRSSAFPNQRDAPHSVTFVHPDWPCDIDLHRYFPGLLAHPPDVFEAFWARRTRVEFAHKPCEILDRPSSLIVMTLNHLRSRASDDLNPRWSAMELSDVEREQLARLARRTGADLGLWEHLVSIGITPRTVSRALIIEAGTGRHGRRLTALALRHSTTRDRLHIVGRLMRGPAAERGDSASWTRRWRRNFRGLVGLAMGQFGSRQDR